MKRLLDIWFATILLAALILPVTGVNAVPGTSSSPADDARDQPLNFISGGHVLSFSENSVLIASGSHALKTEFIGANPVRPHSEMAPAASNNMEAAVPLNTVTYTGLWDGVTMVYQSCPGSIFKSTYYIDASDTAASVTSIRLRYNRPVKLDDQGNLTVTFDAGNMTESKPVAWQEINGEKSPVSAAYFLFSSTEVGFRLADYVSGIPVVIDPVDGWNTFLGGLGTDNGLEIAVDSSGNIYVTGNSNYLWNTPDPPARRPTSGGLDVFVAKLDNNGTILWHTFLGSVYADQARGIAVDSNGNIYVLGQSVGTWGSPVHGFVTSASNMFLAKLTNNGNLVWNTFQGGSVSGIGSTTPQGLVLDTSANIYVTGSATATWGAPKLA